MESRLEESQRWMAKAHSSLTNLECRELLGIESRHRVTRLLGKLVDTGQVQQAGTGKGTRYELPI